MSHVMTSAILPFLSTDYADFVDNVSFEVYMLATLYHSETSVLRLTPVTRVGQDKEVF